VNTPKGRLNQEQRRTLAETLTDAVLVPEVGQFAPAARVGFQVHFVEREADMAGHRRAAPRRRLWAAGALAGLVGHLPGDRRGQLGFTRRHAPS
jgi:hypothetical protein